MSIWETKQKKKYTSYQINNKIRYNEGKSPSPYVPQRRGRGREAEQLNKNKKFVGEVKKRRAIAPFRIQKHLDSISLPYLLGLSMTFLRFLFLLWVFSAFVVVSAKPKCKNKKNKKRAKISKVGERERERERI